MATAGTATSTRRLSDGCGFARDAVEDWRSACGRGRDGRREGSEEFGVGLWWCDGSFHILVFLLYELEPTGQWASW